MTTPGFQAAIFDLDGTLVDTMPLHFQAYRQVFGELGLALEEDGFYASIGGKASETIPRFLGGQRAPIAVDEIHARKKAAVGRLLAERPIELLEAATLLPLLRPLLKLALASSGSRPGVETVLGRLGWGTLFDAVVTGEDVARGKPAPDLFLEAAARLGVPPAACFVFEDTDDGVGAARAAGMQVFDVRRAPPARLRRSGS